MYYGVSHIVALYINAGIVFGGLGLFSLIAMVWILYAGKIRKRVADELAKFRIR